MGDDYQTVSNEFQAQSAKKPRHLPEEYRFSGGYRGLLFISVDLSRKCFSGFGLPTAPKCPTACHPSHCQEMDDQSRFGERSYDGRLNLVARTVNQ